MKNPFAYAIQQFTREHTVTQIISNVAVTSPIPVLYHAAHKACGLVHTKAVWDVDFLDGNGTGSKGYRCRKVMRPLVKS